MLHVLPKKSVVIMCLTTNSYDCISSDCIAAGSFFMLPDLTSHKFNTVREYFLISILKCIQLSPR